MANVFCLIIGSVIGGLSRYYLSGFVQRLSGSVFPYGTLIVNLTGCLVVGVITSVGERFTIAASTRIFLISGFCAAFTTFSAFIIESDFLLRNGHVWTALWNVLASLVGGFVLFRAGLFLGRLA